jgi:hypothetical protein
MAIFIDKKYQKIDRLCANITINFEILQFSFQFPKITSAIQATQAKRSRMNDDNHHKTKIQ